ncbi:uncharacterized protein A4U43_C03F29390 [Asparagus officinalis]|uniref:Uncharacterized protein n=1 Tax=Asparagus officinalis TaxID=4686 RepID=A0A5P1FDT6_ASPOF|nr:uncharacterized protein A4U43_C03F29390 [Asparagus officinalis]
MFGWMEPIRTSYLKLLGEVDSLRANRGVDSERVAERPAQEVSEVEKLKQKLEKSQRKATGLSEALHERGRVETLVKMKKEATMRAKHQLDENHAELGNLDPTEVAGLKSQATEIVVQLAEQRMRAKKVKAKDQGPSRPTGQVPANSAKEEQSVEEQESTVEATQPDRVIIIDDSSLLGQRGWTQLSKL